MNEDDKMGGLFFIAVIVVAVLAAVVLGCTEQEPPRAPTADADELFLIWNEGT